MELIKWDEIRTQIEQAKDIETLKGLSDRLEAIRILAKQSKQSLETQNKIAEYRLRVERKKGEWLKENVQQGGDRKSNSTDSSLILKDIGITWNESSDAQRIANISEETFERLITEIKEEGEELTKSFMVNTAKKIEREIEIQQQREAIESGELKLPEGLFEVIVVDPPWNYNNQDKYNPDNRRGTSPYPELSTEAIKLIKLPSSDNCVLWLWTTHQFIWDAKKIMDYWEFDYKGILVWNKEKMGIGNWLRMQCEFCLLGFRGKPIWSEKDIRDIIIEPRREHSRKPDLFYEMVEKVCFGRKLDYFSREKRKGWSSFGVEVNKFE